MLSPFRWESVKPLAETLSGDHTIFLEVFEDTLNKLLDIQTESKLEFIDPKNGNLDAIDQLVEGTPSKNTPIVSQFLKKQRILNTVTSAEFEEIKRASLEVFDFNAVETNTNQPGDQKVTFLRFLEEFQQFYAFTSDGKVLTFTRDMIPSGAKAHPFGSIVSLDQLDSTFLIANSDGNVYFTAGESLATSSTQHFSLFTY